MQFQLCTLLFRQHISQNCQNTKCGWNPYGVIITPEMELADNTYLDGEGESALKALERADPQTIEPRTIWQTSFLRVQELWGGWWESLLGFPLIHKAVSRISAEILHQMSHQSDTLQVQSPVLVIIGCLDIFSAENIGKSKWDKGIFSRGWEIKFSCHIKENCSDHTDDPDAQKCILVNSIVIDYNATDNWSSNHSKHHDEGWNPHDPSKRFWSKIVGTDGHHLWATDAPS